MLDGATCHSCPILSKAFVVAGPLELAGKAMNAEDTMVTSRFMGCSVAQAVLSGNPPIEIILRRSARARRISLRVSGLDGRVTLSLPKGVSSAEALAFAEEKSDWIRKHLAKQVAHQVPALGGTILWKGQEISIRSAAVKRAQVSDDGLLVPPDPRMVAARIKAHFKLQARHELTEASKDYAGKLGLSIGKITMRDTRSRWGSCSTKGDLNYSWRLIMAPPDVLDYVAAHEVSHLIEMNHSAAYWRVVASIYPDYAAPRRWLRENGQRLHRYRFDD